jgi:type II secretion system protein G
MFRAIHRRRAQKGFTLIELLIVVAIIGIIAAILIPNLIDALQKAKQKRAVADMRNVGGAWFTWLTDQLSAASAGATAGTYDWADLDTDITHADLLTLLSAGPIYIQSVPEFDPWGNSYDYQWASEADVVQVSTALMGVRSPGNDGAMDGDSYTTGSFISSQYANDIVWADGFFVRWPEGAKVVSGSTAPTP